MADIMKVIEPDVAKAADYISEAWRRGVESIIETGRRLIEIRQQFEGEPGKWSLLLGRDGNKPLLPFAKTHAYRLIAVAEDRRLVPHVGQLPSDSFTLHKLTQLSDQRLEELFAADRIHPGMKRNDASAETRRERRDDDERRVLNLSSSEGTFKTLIFDPPWDYDWLSLAGRAAPGYATMSHDELLALDVAQWADDNCHLYLWTTNNFITRAGELMARWGFQHKTVLTWVKPRWGLGSYFRNSTEHVLFGLRGDLRTRVDDIATHFESPVGEHSEKPQTFYDIVLRASYPPYGEGFQRKARPEFQSLFIEKEADDVAV